MDLLIRDLTPGCKFKIVAIVEQSHEGSLSCVGLSPPQRFRVQNAKFLEEGKYTFFDLEKSDEDPDVCRFVSSTEALLHPTPKKIQKNR